MNCLKSAIALFCLIAIVSLTLLGWLSQWYLNSWLLDLASSFQVQYAIAIALLTLLFVWVRRSQHQRIRWGLLLGLACLSFQLSSLLMWYRPGLQVNPPASSHATATHVASIKLLSSNVHPQNSEYERLLKLIESEQPDIVLLQEISPSWLKQMERFQTQLPYHLDTLDGTNWGNAVYSRFPLQEFPALSDVRRKALISTWVYPESTDVSSVTAGLAQTELAKPQSPPAWFKLVLAHPRAPISPAHYQQRQQELFAVFSNAARSGDYPTVVMGDFNASSWSPLHSKQNPTMNLRNARQGFGLLLTWWPRFNFSPEQRWLSHLFWTAIDHCFVSEAIAVDSFRTGPDIASDHLPIIAELKIPIL